VDATDLVAGEQVACEHLEHIAQENVAGWAAAGARYADDPREDAGDGDECQHPVKLRSVGVIEPEQDVERFVAELREWVRGIDCQRCEHRLNLLFKILLQPSILPPGKVLLEFERNSCGSQSGNDLLVPALVLIGYQR